MACRVSLVLSCLVSSVLGVACLPDTRSPAAIAPPVAAKKHALRVGLILSHFGLGDQSFNDMQYNGLIEAYRNSEIDAAFRVPASAAPEHVAPVFEDLVVTNRFNMIFVGEAFLMGDVALRCARRHPDVIFVLFDHARVDLTNVVSVEFAQDEGSHVAGFLASRVTKSRCIGFIGGVDVPVVQVFERYFRRGLDSGAAGCALATAYVSRLPDYSGFVNPKRGYELARDMYASGVDIIFSVAGTTGNGVIQAARDAGKFVIGVDSNQDHLAPGTVLTSMMKRLDRAVTRLIDLRLAGKLSGGAYRFAYGNGGVGLTEMEFTKDLVAPETLVAVRRLERDLSNAMP